VFVNGFLSFTESGSQEGFYLYAIKKHSRAASNPDFEPDYIIAIRKTISIILECFD